MGKGGYIGGSTVIHAGSDWFGRGSVTSQPSEKKKSKDEPKRPAGKKRKGKKKGQPFPNPKGNGLTIPEQIKAAERKVERLASEISQTERKLLRLRNQLENVKKEVERARSLPRRTALGNALHKAQQTEVQKQPAAGKRTL